MKVRSGIKDLSFLKGLNVVPVTVDKNDIYSSMETGVIDAFDSPVDQIIKPGLQEVAHFAVAHPMVRMI